MNIKLLFLIGFIILFKIDVSSQTFVEFYNKGETISQKGIMYVNGNITNETRGGNNGILLIDETLKLTGNFVNNATASLADLTTPSTYGKVIFVGNANTQIIKGTSQTQFENVEINNTASYSPGVLLGQNITISQNLTFTAGHVFLESYNLELDDASITNYNDARFVVTNGIGNLKRNASLTNVVFPVGFTNSSNNYNLLSISNSTVVTKFVVRSQDNQLTNGAIGTAMITDNITNSWYVKPTDTTTSASITMNWNGGDEPITFNRDTCAAIWFDPYSIPAEWKTVSVFSPSLLSKTVTITRNWGWFGVGDKDKFGIRIFAKVLLSGPLNASTGMMSRFLKQLNLIPTKSPYNESPWNAPFQEIIPVPEVANQTVDWILVELRDKANPKTVIVKKAGFLSRLGDIYDTDNSKGLYISGLSPDNYYIAIWHRNHLPVVSSTSIELPNTFNTKFDFTLDLAKSFKKVQITTNEAQKKIITGLPPTNTVYAMWAGDTKKDLASRYYHPLTAYNFVVIRRTGPNNDPEPILTLTGTLTQVRLYSASDVNMDGFVRRTGPNNDPLFIIENVTQDISSGNTQIKSHLP